MQLKSMIAAGGLTVLLATPTLALADKGGVPHHPQGTSHQATTTTTTSDDKGTKATPGPDASHAAKAKAYGKACQGQSKKHVKGQKGTPFSQCVTAMAKAANSTSTSPRKACKSLSRKHVKGEKGTPFSRCVKAAAQVKKQAEQQQDDQQQTSTAS
jgi:hypothetical protein